jgi:hypothetical protein
MALHLSEKIVTVTLVATIFQGFSRILGVVNSEIIDPTTLFEVLFFTLAALNLNLKNFKQMIISTVFIIVLVNLVLISLLTDTPAFETIRAYKWLLFLITLASMNTTSTIRRQTMRTWYLALLSALALAYILQIISFGYDVRPYLILENNYECALLIGLFALNISLKNLDAPYKKLPWNILLVLTILLSGSRSALISLLAVIFIMYLRPENRKSRFLNTLFFTVFCAVVVYFSLIRRSFNLANTDRYTFLKLFWDDFESKSVLSQIFGSWIIKPVNIETCWKLRFYSVLQNDETLGSCYSVIFHSFILRALYDFGIFGTAMIFLFLLRMLRKKLESNLSLCITAIAISNSLSVSGINNVYVIMPICLVLLTESNELRISNSGIVSQNLTSTRIYKKNRLLSRD